MSFTTILKIVGLAGAGMLAALSTLWLEAHRTAVPGWGYVIALLLGSLLLTMTWATFLLLAECDRQRSRANPAPDFESNAACPPVSASPASELTVYTLQPGCCYQIRQTFQDYYGNSFSAGERLTFQQRHFLPYDGGHTLVFAERAMYLQEEVNQVILDGFSHYLVACATN